MKRNDLLIPTRGSRSLESKQYLLVHRVRFNRCMTLGQFLVISLRTRGFRYVIGIFRLSDFLYIQKKEEGNYLSSKIFFWIKNLGSLFTHDCSHSRKKKSGPRKYVINLQLRGPRPRLSQDKLASWVVPHISELEGHCYLLMLINWLVSFQEDQENGYGK